MSCKGCVTCNAGHSKPTTWIKAPTCQKCGHVRCPLAPKE